MSLCPIYLHADESDGRDMSLHQQEVTGGQHATMSPVPGTVDSDVASECHLLWPPSWARGKRGRAACDQPNSIRTNTTRKLDFS